MTQGIEKITVAVEILAEFGNIVGAALEDGKINMADVGLLARLPAVAMGIFSAVSNVTDIRAELADLDPAEKAELVAIFKARFDIPQEKIEVVVEQAASLIEVLYEGYKAVSLFAGSLKAKPITQ